LLTLLPVNSACPDPQLQTIKISIFLPITEQRQPKEPSVNKENDKKEFTKYLTDFTQSSVIQDASIGIVFYLAFAAWDKFLAPDNYKSLWTVRALVAAVCAILLLIHKHSFLQKNRRVVYLLGVSLVLNSITFMWHLASPSTLPQDVSLAAITLVFCMSAFHMLSGDALLIGGLYILGFCWLLFSRNASNQVWLAYMIPLGASFFMGIAGATIGQNYVNRAYRAEKKLREETDRADNLLLKTFPYEVAKELKINHKSTARLYEHATVMFCDVVNFTRASIKMTPEDLVKWLNHTFSEFDRITREHGCEKIKTVGDAYMAVCGVPPPDENHAERILRLALAVKETSEKITLNGEPLQLRIGVSSGPVVAGVIGESRFAYDLWGDTVNTASRMEGLAPAGGILITEATKRLIEGAYTFTQVPSLEVKGKGTMTGWLVYEKNAANNSEQKHVA
jgi:class 3 adenylate cyclase